MANSQLTARTYSLTYITKQQMPTVTFYILLKFSSTTREKSQFRVFDYLSLKYLCSDECPIFTTKQRICVSSIKDVAIPTLWSTHKNIGLTRSIAKQRYKHRRKEKEPKNPIHPQLPPTKPHSQKYCSYETILEPAKHFKYYISLDLMST